MMFSPFTIQYLLVMLLAYCFVGSNLIAKTIQAVRINNATVKIDGYLDDLVWKKAVYAKDFIQRDPLEGAPATDPTEFAVLYEHEYLYIGIMAYCSEPEKIKSILSRRDDATPCDWLCVSLDSYNDNRTAFEFWLNPIGVKRDLRRFDDSGQDINWDALWEGNAARVEEGWSAEFKIPFSELRFGSNEDQFWGIQVYRYMAEKNEDNFWAYWPKEEMGWVRHYGELTGLTDIPRQKRIYVTPYVTAQYDKANYFANPVHPKTYDLDSNYGVDIKYGLTNNLTFDLTVNPDFGQVEADPAELNLTAFETYFPEKRPFFVEGGNIFNFSLGIGENDQSNNGLFYTRRIGRRPHYYVYDSEGYENNPRATRILSAGKLSGRTDSDWSLGILNAITARETGTVEFADDTPTLTKTVEPLTNYFVSRVQKDFGEGTTTLGGIFTSTNRRIPSEDSHLNFLTTDSYTGGIDFSHRFGDDKYYIQGTFTVSDVIGSHRAITRIQTNANHYFQRPDATHLRVDSSATYLMGFAHKFFLLMNRGEHWQYGVGEWSYSPGFEANDLGFHHSVDSQIQFLWIGYRENDPGEVVRRYNLSFNTWHSATYGWERVALGTRLSGGLTLMNYWQFGGGMNYEAPSYHLTGLWGGPSIKADARHNLWFFASSDPRKKVFFILSAFRGADVSGTQWWGFTPNVTWRPMDNFSVRTYLSYNYTFDNWASWRGYEPVEDLQYGSTHYIMAELEQQLLSMTLRFDLTITPNFTIQYYGSPYLIAGKYRGHKLLVDPKGEHFNDRFARFDEDEIYYNSIDNTWVIDRDHDGVTNFIVRDYDFNYKEFNSNLVLRWEYITGSTIYLVWSQGIQHATRNGEFEFTQDINTLFHSDVENILLVKFSYLLNL